MFRQRLEKKILDMEKYMESFKRSISKRFENQEKIFRNKIESFELTQKEYRIRLSRLEDRRDTDENEGIELQRVKNFKYFYFSHFWICINFKTIFIFR